jgi:Ca2+-binding RTX toxin-like protein
MAAKDMGLTGSYDVKGDAMDNVFYTADGDDTVRGAAGNDLVKTYGRNDVLAGGEGDDSSSGGDGDDLLGGGAVADNLDGGAGVDTAEYSDMGSIGATTNLATGYAGRAAEGDVLIANENLTGTDLAGSSDFMTGDDKANRLSNYEPRRVYRQLYSGGFG